MTDAFNSPEETSVAEKLADAPPLEVVDRIKEAAREAQARKEK